MIFMAHSPIWHMAENMGVKYDNKGNWLLNDNTLEERLDRRRRLKEHVVKLGYKINVDNHEKIINKDYKEKNKLKSYNEFWGYGKKGLELKPAYA